MEGFQSGAVPPPDRRCGSVAGDDEQLRHGGAQPDAIALGGEGAEQGAVEALVVRTQDQAPSHDPLGLSGLTLAQQPFDTPQHGVHHRRLDLGQGPVEDGPIGTAQPAEEGAADQPERLDQPAGSGQSSEAVDVGPHRALQAEPRPTRQS